MEDLRWRIARFAWVSVLACALSGCAPSGSIDSPPAGPDDLQGAILIVLDTVRPDHLSAYGHHRPTSPEIDRLAADGVLFEQVVSSAPWTLPAAVALLSGRQPPAVFRDNRLQESIVESIRDAGFATAAFTEGGYLSRRFGFDLGFDEYSEEEGAVQLLTRGERRDTRPSGGIESTFRQAREWVAAHRDERFFLMIHTYEPHTPYTRPELTGGLDPGQVGETFGIERLAALRSGAQRFTAGELEYLSALYDGGILESDRHVGRFIGELDSLGLRDRTMIVVTSDHGEELGAHYPTHCADHGHSLLDDQVLVPLIISDPALRVEPSRIRAQVRSLDILPTIVERLGLRAPDVAGASLVPLMRGTETAGRPAIGGSTKAGPSRAFLRHLGYKFIEADPRQARNAPPLTPEPPRVQLYDLQADPGETRNIAADRPELVERFRRELAELRAGRRRGIEPPDPQDEQLNERLRSLGYAR